MERSEFSKATIHAVFGKGPYVVVLGDPGGLLIERHYEFEQERNERVLTSRLQVTRTWNEE